MDKPVQVKLIVDGTISTKDGTVKLSTEKIKGLDVLDENNNPMQILWKIELDNFAIDCKLTPVANLEVERLVQEDMARRKHENNQA